MQDATSSAAAELVVNDRNLDWVAACYGLR